MGLFDRIKKEVGEVFNQAPARPAPVRTPAPSPRPAPVARTAPSLSVQPMAQPRLSAPRPVAPMRVAPVQVPKFNVAPVAPAPKVNPVQVAQPRPLMANNKPIMPSSQSRTNVAGPVIKPTTREKVGGAGLGVARSIVGGGQFVSGIADLASPGRGTNRVSKLLDTVAKDQDYRAKQLGVTGQYKAGQVGGEIAQLATGQGIVKGGLKLGGKVMPKVAQLSGNVQGKVDNLTSGLVKGNLGQRVVGGTIRNVVNPTVQANSAALTAFMYGKEASKGNDVEVFQAPARFEGKNIPGIRSVPGLNKLPYYLPQGVASDLALNTIGLGGLKTGVQQVGVPAVNAAQNAPQAVKDIVTGKPLRQIPDADLGAINRVRQSQTGFGDAIANASEADYNVYRQAQAKLGSTDPSVIDNLIAQRNAYDVRQANKQPLFAPLNEGGYVPVPFAKRINTKLAKIDNPEHIDAIKGTPGAALTPDGIELDVSRFQKPEQAGMESVRDGVFYLPENKSAYAKHYKTGSNGYGGKQAIQGRTLVKNPLMVKAATGGNAPKLAYDQIKGKGSYDKLRERLFDVLPGWTGKVDEAKIYNVLDEFGGNPDKTWDIIQNSKEGNQLMYALIENITANNVRKAGFDSVLGYSKKRDGTHNLSELFDVRENRYPEADGGFSVHSDIEDDLLPDAPTPKLPTQRKSAPGSHHPTLLSEAQKRAKAMLDEPAAKEPIEAMWQRYDAMPESPAKNKLFDEIAARQDDDVVVEAKANGYDSATGDFIEPKKGIAQKFGLKPLDDAGKRKITKAEVGLANGIRKLAGADKLPESPAPVQSQKIVGSLADNNTTRLKQDIADQQDFLSSPNVKGGVRRQAEKKLANLEAQLANGTAASTKPTPQLSDTAKLPQPQKSTPVVATPVKSPLANNTTIRERGAITSMKEPGLKGSAEFTEALNARKNNYKVRNTNQLQTKAANLVKDNEDAALRVAKNGTDDKSVATGFELIDKYVKEGKLEQAIDLAEVMAPKLTEAGRTSQAASVWGRLTPAGALRFTQRQLDKYNDDAGLVKNGQQTGKKAAKTLSPEKAKEITDLAKQVQKLPEGDAKIEAIGKLTNAMNTVAPTPVLTKLTNIWRAGLLTSVRTLEGGIIGNTSKAALDLPAQTIAAGIDKFITAPLLNKGQRSNALTIKGRLSGGAEGIGRGARYFKTGVDPRNVAAGYDTKGMNLTDGNKVVNTLGKGAEYVYRAMGTIDNPFYYSALKAARREQAVIEATNKGLKGMEKQAYINSGKLSLKGDETAANDALKAVFQNDTSLGTIAAKLKNAPQSIKDPNSRVAAQLAVDILIPFVKIPSAVATALVDYSPVGLAAEVAKQGFRQELDIRNLNNAIGKSTVGTAGAIYIGSQLYDKGMLTLEAPQDTNERQLWALEGKQPFSVKINGKWRKLNYVQPFGSLMAVGGGFNRAKKEGENPYASSIASGMKAVSDQSFLKGVAGAVSAVQDPARSADTFLNNTAGSVVPNFIRDLARATDSKEREVNSVKEAVKNGLPGLRNDNLPQRDPFGNEIKRKQSPAGVMLDPFKSTTDKTDPVTSEIRRLYDIDRTNPDLKAAPSKLTKQQTFAGEDVVLTPEQLDKFEATVGPAAYSKITQAMQTPEYKAGTDVDKAKDIKDIISETRANSKADFATTNKLQDKKKQDVTLDATKFKERTTTLGASSGSGTKVAANADAQTKKVLGEYNSLSKEEVNKKAYKEYDYDYKVAKARYENAKAKGEYSKADDLAARDRVRKLKAGSGFSKDTRDYYSLSSDQLARLVETDPEGTKIVEQVLAYGDKLTAEGVQTKNKFRDKKGNVTIATNKAKAAASGAKGRRSSGSASVAKASVDYSGTNKLAGMSRGKFRSSTNGGKSIARKVRQQSYKVKRTLPKRVKGVA